jgi:hypothetical protein
VIEYEHEHAVEVATYREGAVSFHEGDYFISKFLSFMAEGGKIK